jgi:hypothetical protein
MLPDLAGLVRALNQGEVRFVVIGAVAVGAHGHIRATQDLDIVPDPDRENLDRLGNTLVLLGAHLATDASHFVDPELRRALYQGRNLTLTTELGDLDVVQRLPGIPSWEQLVGQAERTTLAGETLLVTSRRHLIEMKRARHSLQDQADLEVLVADNQG